LVVAVSYHLPTSNAIQSMYGQLARRALTPAGAAATVASLGFFTTEHLSSKASGRVANQTMQAVVKNCQLQQPRALYFSSQAKSACGGGKKIVKAAATKAAASTASTTITTATTATTTATTAPKAFSILGWYEGHLTARPVLTKMLTGSVLWGIGDCVAQVIPHYAAGAGTVAVESSAVVAPPLVYDFARTGRAVFFGFAIHAPTSHVHFNFLEYMTNKAGVTGLAIPVFKAFMEQVRIVLRRLVVWLFCVHCTRRLWLFVSLHVSHTGLTFFLHLRQFVYWSWISNSLYHGTMGVMQGQTLEQSYQRICDVLWETQKAQWVFWIPIQLLNFRYVPIRHQLNVVLLTSIVWTALLSAWYPPQSTDAKTEEALEAATHE